MITVAQVVANLIDQKPFLSEAIHDGIINLSSLARQILPEVQQKIKEPVSLAAISMALKRYTPHTEIKLNNHLSKIVNSLGDIIVRSNLTDFTYSNSDTLFEKQIQLLHEFKGKKEIFYTFVQGVYESNFVVSHSMKKTITEIFKKEKLVSCNEGLSSITIKLPAENINIPGLYYYLLRRIAWEGINIMEVISSTNEFTIIVKDEDIETAFFVIKNIRQK